MKLFDKLYQDFVLFISFTKDLQMITDHHFHQYGHTLYISVFNI